MEKPKGAAENKQEDTASNEEKTSVDVSNNTLVEGESSKKSNGESAQPRRGRGRPRLSDTKQAEQHGVSLKTTAVVQTAENVLNGGSDTPKRGRPKGTTKCKLKSLASGEEEEGSPVTPRKRGRPKTSLDKELRIENTVSGEGDGETDGNQNSVKRKRGRPRKHTSVSSGTLDTPVRRRGRPKMSVDKEPRTENTVSSEGDGETDGNQNSVKRKRGRPRKHTSVSSTTLDTPLRRRGRPRKCIKQNELVRDGSQPERRGRGRPKGSLNKSRVLDKVGRPLKAPGLPAKGKKRGRPRLQPAKRGRPRKYPLPSPEEVKKPKVWKPLGRPRKYPRVETSAEAPPPPRRSRGRPCKSESKKGAHLRKNARSASSTPHAGADGVQRKRGRPASVAKGEGDVPRKRGRPKGSVNKNRARSWTQLNSSLSKAESESPAAGGGSEVGFETEIILA